MKRLRSIEEIDNLFGMRVIVRASLDVSLESSSKKKDAYRVLRALPTIQHLIEKGARCRTPYTRWERSSKLYCTTASHTGRSIFL